MDIVDRLLADNAEHVSSFHDGGLSTRPSAELVVVTCMDSRIDVFAALGLRLGEAHILRNAGGVVTSDTIRSLAVSQRVLGTRHVVLVHHTRCGLIGLSEDEFRAALLRELGTKPTWSLEAFTDLEADLRSSVARVQSSPFLPHRDSVHGFIYDVDTGALRPVPPGPESGAVRPESGAANPVDSPSVVPGPEATPG